jgi:hypothetical protein
VVTICTASLTFSNSTFCPHSVFMCFVWIWEQTAIMSLYNINWLVFITETVCVYCAVRTGSLYLVQVSVSPNRSNSWRTLGIFWPVMPPAIYKSVRHYCLALHSSLTLSLSPSPSALEQSRSLFHTRFYIKTLTNTTSTLLWHVTSFSLVIRCRHFGGRYCFHRQGRRVIVCHSRDFIKMFKCGESSWKAAACKTVKLTAR